MLMRTCPHLSDPRLIGLRAASSAAIAMLLVLVLDQTASDRSRSMGALLPDWPVLALPELRPIGPVDGAAAGFHEAAPAGHQAEQNPKTRVSPVR